MKNKDQHFTDKIQIMQWVSIFVHLENRYLNIPYILLNIHGITV